ncbi:MAG: hypothetical protein JXR03_21635 [Cyclobacteriaceae bacterium]
MVRLLIGLAMLVAGGLFLLNYQKKENKGSYNDLPVTRVRDLGTSLVLIIVGLFGLILGIIDLTNPS